MIDAFACLSIATATAQFIDFAVEVLKKAREIQKSNGTVKELSVFKHDLNQFKALCIDLQNSSKDQVATVNSDGHAVTDVADRCERLSNDILEALKKLDIPDGSSKMRNLKMGFKVQIKADEFKEFEQQLMHAKVDLCTHLLKALGKLPYQIETCFSRRKSNRQCR
jgi:hypothetical protein